MSSEIDIGDLFETGLSTVRMIAGPPPKVAGIDFVMVVTGKDNDQCSKIIRRIQEEDRTWWANLKKFKFSGPGQREIYVVSASEAIERLMMLPGKEAKEFRRGSSKLLTRLFAGDPTLHDLIEKNGLSDGVIHRFAQGELASNAGVVGVPIDEETQLIKKIHLATMRQQLDDIEQKRAVAQLEHAHQRTISQLEHVSWLCKQCVVGAPESQRMWMEESNRNYKISVFNSSMSSSIGGGQLGIENGQTPLGGPVYTDDMKPVTISTHIIIPKGLKDPDNTMAKAIGTVAAEMYRDWNEGQKPLKEIVTIKGYPVEVNKYFKKDLPLLEAAFVENEKRTRMAELQKLERARRVQEKGEARDVRQAEERLLKEEKATEKASRELAKKDKERVRDRGRMDKELHRQAEIDAANADNRRKSDLLANQPSMYKYWK